MTTNEARAYFKDKGLCYQDVKLSDLHYLRETIDEHFIRFRKRIMQTLEKPLYWKRVNDAKFYKGTFDPITGAMVCAFLTANGEYFDAREVISFNRDGYIGFCGSADSENTAPVLAAFVEWCDWLAERKETDHEC